MKKTTFTFFKNTPIINFQNTIHFKSNRERDTFFLEGGHYPILDNIEEMDFNFVRDRSSIRLEIPYDDMRGVNYCTFKSDFEDVRYYAYVINYEYLNDGAVQVYLLIDGIMTFTQGTVLEQLTNLNITRQHLTKVQYDNQLWELRNNDDILKTNTKSYFHSDRLLFSDLIVLITSSVDLVSDFGTVDDPKMKTSHGRPFDKITSPLNLYACEFEDFNKLMLALAPFPWISQNIKSLILLPKIFMTDNLTNVTFGSGDSLKGVTYLKELSGVNTNKSTLSTELAKVSYDMNATLELFELDTVQDRHLLRSEYTTTELYNYSGGSLFVDNGQLNEYRGLAYKMDIVTGHHNEMKVYIDQYRVDKGLGDKNGSYLNDSLVFNSFDDIPMLIDSYNLALSKNANQREHAESKLITNRISNVMDSNASLKDRFFNGASLISNLSPSNLFGKFSDEHDYYQRQKAENADLALETPSITNQTNGNSFNIANQNFGIHFKYSKPSQSEMAKIKKYYKMFGYQMDDFSNSLDSIHSMTICNYLQFSGSWSLPHCDVALIEMMYAQFENGIRFWHNNNTPNPMNQNVLNNEMKV